MIFLLCKYLSKYFNLVSNFLPTLTRYLTKMQMFTFCFSTKIVEFNVILSNLSKIDLKESVNHAPIPTYEHKTGLLIKLVIRLSATFT